MAYSKVPIKQETVTISIAEDHYRKWEMLRVGSTGQTGIIIKSGSGSLFHSYTIYPYKHPRNRFWRFIKFQWLKLRVFLKIIG